MTAKWGKNLCWKGTFECTHRFATCSNALWCGRPPKRSHLCLMGNTNSLLTTSYMSKLQHTYVFKAGWWQLGQKKHHKTPITLHLHRHGMLTEASEGRVCEDWMMSKRSAVFYRDVMVSPLWEEFWVIEVKVDIEAMQQTHILLIKSYVKPNHVFGALCEERTIMIFFKENMLDSQEMEIWHCLYF